MASGAGFWCWLFFMRPVSNRVIQKSDVIPTKAAPAAAWRDLIQNRKRSLHFAKPAGFAAVEMTPAFY
jgi:hypothetical protein